MKVMLMIVFAVVAHLGLGVVVASADSIIVPEEWAGIWQSEITRMDCEMNVIGSSTSIDTLCAGDPYEVEDFVDVPCAVDCTGTVTGTDVAIDCSAECVFPGCTASFSWSSNITRGSPSSDVAQGVDIFIIDYEGIACFLPDTCERKEYTFTRIGDDSSCTFTDAAGQTWGNVKGTYR